MGIGVGVLKEELGYDLSSADYTFDSVNAGDFVKDYACKVYGIYFHFTTEQAKTVEIALKRTSGGTTYVIYYEKKSLPTETDWVWKHDLELPATIEIEVKVSQTDGACSMNMLITYK